MATNDSCNLEVTQQQQKRQRQQQQQQTESREHSKRQVIDGDADEPYGDDDATNKSDDGPSKPLWWRTCPEHHY